MLTCHNRRNWEIETNHTLRIPHTQCAPFSPNAPLLTTMTWKNWFFFYGKMVFLVVVVGPELKILFINAYWAVWTIYLHFVHSFVCPSIILVNLLRTQIESFGTRRETKLLSQEKGWKKRKDGWRERLSSRSLFSSQFVL